MGFGNCSVQDLKSLQFGSRKSRGKGKGSKCDRRKKSCKNLLILISKRRRSAKKAWRTRKSRKGSRKSRKGSRKSRKGSRKSRKGSRKSRKGRRSRRFGDVMGPGHQGDATFATQGAAYFGSLEPFVSPPEWSIPITNGQYQYPQGLISF
jgi:hypothetical protein